MLGFLTWVPRLGFLPDPRLPPKREWFDLSASFYPELRDHRPLNLSLHRWDLTVQFQVRPLSLRAAFDLGKN